MSVLEMYQVFYDVVSGPKAVYDEEPEYNYYGNPLPKYVVAKERWDERIPTNLLSEP